MSLWPNKELRTTTVACTVNQERSHQIICCSGRYVLCSGTFIFSGCFGLFHLLACLIGHVLSSGMFTYLRLRRVLCSGTFIPSACFAMFDFLACFLLSPFISIHICGQVLLVFFVVATTGRPELLLSSAV